MDLLFGNSAKAQQAALQQQAEQIAASQRTSLAQIAAEQGQLDQAAAGGGRKRRGQGLLKFITSTPGAAALG